MNAGERPEFSLPVGQEVMDGLKRNIGQAVIIKYTWTGEPRTFDGELLGVTDFERVHISGIHLTFVGYGSGIREICAADGAVLYQNPLISENYSTGGDEAFLRLVHQTFGEEVAGARRAELEEFDAMRANEREQERAEQLQKLPGLIEDGKKAMRLSQREEWIRVATELGEDSYGSDVLEEVVYLGRILSEGKTPEEALELVKELEATGNSLTIAIGILDHFHERGEELKVAWNSLYVPDEAARYLRGVVNPAWIPGGFDELTPVDDIPPGNLR